MIVKEGYPFVIGFSLLGLCAVGCAPWIGRWGGFLGALFFLLGSFSLFFFRNPERIITKDEQCIYAAGDGVIMNVTAGDVTVEGYRGTLIQVFLSIFDVHIQRSPVAGVIDRMQYKKGAFLPAMHPEAAEKNEKNTVFINHKKGIIIVSQIAGIIAQRIVSWYKKGDALEQGQRYGLICFGSQVDILIPESAVATVKKGDRVKAGITVIGKWQ